MVAPRKVMIVDDEPDLRAIVRLTLKSIGLEVLEAENGRRGLELLRQARPDLIILDIMMPEMNGVEFCRHLIDDDHIDDIPLILLSAVSERSRIVKDFFEMPFRSQSFLTKPLDTEELLRRVGEALGVPVGPRPAAAPSAAAPAPQVAPEGPRFSILVVDDEEDIRAVMKAGLGTRHAVETAENGMDALSKIDEVNPDFVMCDVNMPVMDGLATVEAIRSHPRFHAIPVFFCTGEKAPDLPKKSYEVGANLFIRKPVDPLRLLKVIDYFAREAGITPGALRPRAAPPASPAAPSPAPGALRVAVINADPQQTARLRHALADKAFARLETLWTDDPKAGLGNLTRWEPDLIFYHVRNPGYDGIAFVQLLRLKKLAAQFVVAFTGGKDVFDADQDYSRKQLGLGVIRLDAPEEHIRQGLRQALEKAGPKPKTKRRSLAQIEAEDRELLRRVQEEHRKTQMQREAFRARFARIQAFIDTERQEA